MTNELLKWLENWYQSQTNGDWEHQYGIKINTLDNPGWSVEIDLTATELEKRKFDNIKVERSPNDWITCQVESDVFRAYCGPKNLSDVLEIFRKWVQVKH